MISISPQLDAQLGGGQALDGERELAQPGAAGAAWRRGTDGGGES